MNKIVSIAILVVGIILLCLAYNSYHSAASGVSRVFTGSSTSKTVMFLVGGLVAAAVGLAGVMSGSRRV